MASIAAVGIAWEDLRWRMVHVYWYPVLLIGLGGMAILREGLGYMLTTALINLFFVFILLLILTLYFSFKERRIVYLFDSYLGWGDVLFLLSIVVYFDLEQYILFTIGSVFIALLLTPGIFWIQGKNRQVPLAGIQGLCLLVQCWLAYFNKWNIPTLLPYLM